MSAPKQPRPDENEPVSGLTFEHALEQVEEIIERIEKGQTGLERSLAEYERGVALIRHCRAVLDRAEQRIEELTAQMDADRRTTPPDAVPDPAEGPGV